MFLKIPNKSILTDSKVNNYFDEAKYYLKKRNKKYSNLLIKIDDDKYSTKHSINYIDNIKVKSRLMSEKKNPILSISIKNNNEKINKIESNSKGLKTPNNTRVRSLNLYNSINNDYCLANSNISKNNIHLNSKTIHNKTPKLNLKIFSDIYSKNKNKGFFKKKKNYINYIDRNKIRNIDLISMKLFDDYVDEKNSKNSSKNNSLSIKNQDTYTYKDLDLITENDNIFRNASKFNNNIKGNYKKDIHHNFFTDNFNLKSEDRLRDVKNKLSLRQLMQINPYHYVSKAVKYSNSIEMKKISEKLGNIHGADFNIKATSRRHFFRGQSDKIKNNKNNKRVISSFQVTFNTNITHRGGLIWRILQKLRQRNIHIISSFRQACKFKAYSELWKYHSMVIEKLLVNYNEFKWFYEKDKYMKEEVFNEFLECKKLQVEMKEELSFGNKVFLAFDELNAGEINLKKFFLVMELTSKSNINIDKIKFIIQLFEDYNLRYEEKSINISEMNELLKILILFENSQKDTKYLHETIRKELNNGEKIDNNIYIRKKDVYDFLINNKIIHKIIQGFIAEFKFADINYIEEVNSSFNSTVRNVKKFLNEQKEVLCDNDNHYYKFEKILKSIQAKTVLKEKTKIIEDEFENNSIEDYN